MPDTFGSFFVSLLLTALIYTAPIAIYRYAILGHPVDKRKAHIIVIVYAASLYLLESVIFYISFGEVASVSAIAFWSMLNCQLLTRPKQTTASPSQQPIQGSGASAQQQPVDQTTFTTQKNNQQIPVNLYTITKRYKEQIECICAEHGIGSHVYFEVLPVLYYLTDISAYQCGYDTEQRQALSKSIVNELKKHSLFSDSSKNLFWSRINFYRSFYEGREARAIYLFKRPEQTNGSKGIVYAFGDILYYPDIVNDYDNAPTLLQDFDRIVEFQQVFLDEISPMLVEYCEEMRAYLSSVR